MAETLADPRAPLADPKTVAEFLGVTQQALGQMRYLGRGPKYIKITGRAVRYRWSDVLEWVEAQARTHT